jgi:polysaccharide biosynthesis transport protein
MKHFNSAPASINFSDVTRGMLRHKFLIIVTLAIGIGAGLGLVTVVKPSYQTEAQLLIGNLATSYDGESSLQDSRPQAATDRDIRSQTNIIKANDLALRVIKQLQLTKNPEFNSTLKGVSPMSEWLIRLGFSDDPRLMTPEHRAMSRIARKLVVYQIPETNVIGIKYASANPRTAAAVANQFAENYIASTRELQASATGRSRDWLGSQIEDLRLKVSESENAVEVFRAENGLLKGERATLNQQEISELNSQLTIAESARSEAKARAGEIKQLLASQGNVDSSNDVLASPIVQRLREQQVTTSRKISELSATYLGNHPKVIAAQRDLANIDRQIRKEALKIVQSLEGQAKIATARALALQQNLAELKDRESTANLDDVRLNELQRVASANRVLLETMMARYVDASARQDLELVPGMARVIQRAEVPSSIYFPRKGPVVTLLAFAGLALGLGLAFVMEIMNAAKALGQLSAQAESPAAPHPIAENIFIPVAPAPVVPMPAAAPPAAEFVAAMPIAEPAAPEPPHSDPVVHAEPDQQPQQDPDQDIVQHLANTISQDIATRKHGRISFTRIGGETFDAAAALVATARKLAALKRKVLIMDVDRKDKAVENLLGLQPAAGLADAVTGNGEFSRIIARDPDSPVHIIRYGNATDAQTAGLLADRLQPIMASLTGIYDVILVHGGQANISTPDLIRHCHMAFLLAHADRHRDVALAAETLMARGVELVHHVELAELQDVELAQSA